MHLLPLHRVRLEMGVKLATLPKPVKRGLDISHVHREELLDHMMAVLNGAVIVKPDTILTGDCSRRPGKFGEDEPHPFPELEGKFTGY